MRWTSILCVCHVYQEAKMLKAGVTRKSLDSIPSAAKPSFRDIVRSDVLRFLMRFICLFLRSIIWCKFSLCLFALDCHVLFRAHLASGGKTMHTLDILLYVHGISSFLAYMLHSTHFITVADKGATNIDYRQLKFVASET